MAPGADTSASSVPPAVLARLDGLVGVALDPGLLIRLAIVGRGKNVDANHVATVSEDGDYRVAFQAGEDAPPVPSLEDLPRQPGGRIPAEDLAAVRSQLDDDGFADLDLYQAATTVEDGEYLAVRARTGAGEHEVVYDGVAPDAVSHLRRWISVQP